MWDGFPFAPEAGKFGANWEYCWKNDSDELFYDHNWNQEDDEILQINSAEAQIKETFEHLSAGLFPTSPPNDLETSASSQPTS